MKVLATPLRDVKLIHLPRFEDARGWFAEAYNAKLFAAEGLPSEFAQDNHSFSAKGVLRGLHYQVGKPQGKLVRVLSGKIWDVAVDLRRSSPEFGQWAGFELETFTEEGDLQCIWLPEGYAHGFLVLSDIAEVLYKATDFYFPSGERSILWNDPELGIAWPLDTLAISSPIVNGKDAAGCNLVDAETL